MPLFMNVDGRAPLMNGVPRLKRAFVLSPRTSQKILHLVTLAMSKVLHRFRMSCPLNAPYVIPVLKGSGGRISVQAIRSASLKSPLIVLFPRIVGSPRSTPWGVSVQTNFLS